jgi:hypothetical protein
MNTLETQESKLVDTPLEFGRYVFVTFIGLLLLLLGLYVYRFGITTSTSQSIWGAFGDFLGGTLNPLISFLTLIVAINVWQLQKRELAATRQSLEQSMDVAKEQANLMNVQRIEQTMFSLIEQLRQSIKEFSVAKHFNRIDGPGDLVGLEAVAMLHNRLSKRDPEWHTPSEWFDHLVEGYQIKNFETLALGIKELLSFITRNSSNDESRKIWFGMSIALLGEKPFELAYKWGEHYNDPILMSCFEDMRKLRSKAN